MTCKKRNPRTQTVGTKQTNGYAIATKRKLVQKVHTLACCNSSLPMLVEDEQLPGI